MGGGVSCPRSGPEAPPFGEVMTRSVEERKLAMLKALRDVRNPLSPTRLYSISRIQSVHGKELLQELIDGGNVEVRPHRTAKHGEEVWLVDDRL